MTPSEKVFSVLREIKKESSISPDPNFIEFKFNYVLVGYGIVYGDDEKKILRKLEQEKIIEILAPRESKGVVSSIELLDATDSAIVRFGPKFRISYFKYFLLAKLSGITRDKSDKLPSNKKLFSNKWFIGFLVDMGVVILIIKFDFNLQSVNLGIFELTPPLNNKMGSVTQSIKQDAKTTADSIIISGWEDAGDYIGYLSQITGFYQRHKEIYSQEYITYNRQLEEWQNRIKDIKDGRNLVYASDLDGLKGLIIAGRNNLNNIVSK